MTSTAAFASGKGRRDENFPVASHLVRAELRPPIMAFYRFARAADDVADHATAGTEEKFGQLARMEAALRGEIGVNPEGEALHAILQARGLPDQHALDLLEAFRRDVTKRRYADWLEVLDYCRYSASPVGRFVLDLHGEARTLWPLNDALCVALQMINHLQDCAEDYRTLDRVYLPLDTLAAHGIGSHVLADAQASPALRTVIVELAGRVSTLLDQSKIFASQIVSTRLALEVGIIHRLAESLVVRLTRRDPLSERMQHYRIEAISLAMRGSLGVAASRLRGAFVGHKWPSLRGEKK